MVEGGVYGHYCGFCTLPRTSQERGTFVFMNSRTNVASVDIALKST